MGEAVPRRGAPTEARNLRGLRCSYRSVIKTNEFRGSFSVFDQSRSVSNSAPGWPPYYF